ncbi:PP2C family protein-serine/threonine phosphatase [Marinobacterium stanieri]|uniref:Serine phosphatase RsbU, regulator of sigma subunit n=1 Tax=Marinobacterium stanieri TaxID=49186 RepID=A0A1N6Q4U4_9GAMM|nr:SpoIIE family protein phosphatase [Marinobacterium stanieri]SIQ11623.1 Serine phosphatase RsbU, regulator of sigma subunit [Marinobacterium stanieri]
MDLHHQRVLLLSASAETSDRIFELCSQCDHHQLTLVHCADLEEVEHQLDHFPVSLLIFDLASVGSSVTMDALAQRLSPKPLVALIEEGTAEQLVAALRSGADDVYVIGELQLHPDLFIQSVERQLKRARYIEEVYSLRDSLERSLDELREDQHAAQQVQLNLLPPTSQRINSLEFDYILKPSLLLSGDFVDAFPINDQLSMFYLADVSGHGASSALVTVLLKNMTHRLLRNYRRNSSFDILSPVSTLERINREMLLTSLGKHLTMFVGVIDHDRSCLDYAVGGHHPLPILRQNGEVRYLEGKGMPLGLFDEPHFERHFCELDTAFDITLFSDGILEIIDGDSLREKEDCLLRQCSSEWDSPEQLLQSMMPAGRADNPDDVAIMRVRRDAL